MRKLFILSAALLACTFILGAQTVRESVSLRINSEDGLYEKGQTVKVWADVKNVPDSPLTFKVMKWAQWHPESETVVTLREGENLLFERKVDEAVQYVFELTDGKNPKSFKGKSEVDGNVFAGVVVGASDFKPGFTQPDGLYEFWNGQIKAMRKEKMHPEITKDETVDEVRKYHVDINCVGPAPLRAYVAHPANAKKHSLPIILFLHSAGKPGSPSKADVAISYATIVEGGALAMDLNAHGMLDDQSDEYYKELNNGLLNGYSTREPDENLENYYFKWMMLRAVRALDYLTKSPLWDGKHVIVSGTSQGGYQSAFLAGIDKRVTSAILTVPAGLDQGASLQGRSNSWPGTMRRYPENSQKYLPYIDPAAFLWNTKADIWCEIGLYDLTCPAANLFAVMNTVNGEKTIVTFQRPHSLMYYQKNHGPVDELRKEFFQKAAMK